MTTINEENAEPSPEDLPAYEERSMPATIGMWVENFEEYTLFMNREEFDSTIADTKWLLEMLRKARRKAPKASDWVDPTAAQIASLQEKTR